MSQCDRCHMLEMLESLIKRKDEYIANLEHDVKASQLGRGRAEEKIDELEKANAEATGAGQ